MRYEMGQAQQVIYLSKVYGLKSPRSLCETPRRREDYISGEEIQPKPEDRTGEPVARASERSSGCCLVENVRKLRLIHSSTEIYMHLSGTPGNVGVASWGMRRKM